MFHFDDAERALRRLNATIERYMPLLTPTGVVLGLILSTRIAWMKGAATWLFAFLTLVNAMGVSVSDFGKVIKKPRPLLSFALCAYLLIPCAVHIAGNLFFSNPDTVTGYILLYCIPTAVVGCVWSGIYRGNMALSLTILVIATCLAPFITPLSIKLLASSSVVLDTSGMIKSLFLMVVIPSLIGVLINFLTKGKCADRVQPDLKPFTKVALLLVIIINTSQVAERIISEATWAYVPQALGAALFTSMGFFISYAISHLMKLDHQDTISVVYAGGMRNISAALVLAIEFFPPATSIPVISGIVLQQTTCAIISHFLFGTKPEEKSGERRNIKNEKHCGRIKDCKSSY